MMVSAASSTYRMFTFVNLASCDDITLVVFIHSNLAWCCNDAQLYLALSVQLNVWPVILRR